MNNPCEWCVQTSSQIDSLEYQLEQALRMVESVKTISAVRRVKLETANKRIAELEDMYYRGLD